MDITIENAKCYLRVDTLDEDEMIERMLQTAKSLVRDVLRAEDMVLTEDNPEVEIAIFYALAYLYEHRENANHKELLSSLRNLLFGQRKEVF